MSPDPLHVLTHPPQSSTLDSNQQSTGGSAAVQSPPVAIAMKDRTVSGASERSTRATSQLMSVSPPPHRVSSRSPATSIPSSPTSVHSSSSAIFERDIEPSPSHPLVHAQPHATNPHRTPRSKATEHLDQSVPSVLDSAAALLTTTDELEESQIAVEAPIASPSRGTSSIGSPAGVGSRSPSPTTSSGGGWKRTSMLLNLPSPVQSSIIPLSPATSGRGGGSPPFSGSPSRPPLMMNISSTSTDANMPGGLSAPLRASSPHGSVTSTQYESAASSPTTTTMEHPPHPLPDTPTATRSQQAQQPASPIFGSHSSITTSHPSHPPSPSNTANKRLSFISYNDILSSNPTATQPLSNLTSSASSEPPPHLPTVSISLPAPVGSRTASASASAAGSTRNSVIYETLPPFVADVKEPDSEGDLGGEWEREGLGRGLEERLEALMTVGPGKA